MLLEIRKFNDPILKAVCDPIEPGDDISFIRDMMDTLRNQPTGVGLAAPQVGIAKRAILIRPEIRLGIRALINPVIEPVGDETDVMIEGCLSYPGIGAKIERHKSIRVKYLEVKRNGKLKEKSDLFLGWDARIVLNEADHIDGICLVGDAWRKLSTANYEQA